MSIAKPNGVVNCARELCEYHTNLSAATIAKYDKDHDCWARLAVYVERKGRLLASSKFCGHRANHLSGKKMYYGLHRRHPRRSEQLACISTTRWAPPEPSENCGFRRMLHYGERSDHSFLQIEKLRVLIVAW